MMTLTDPRSSGIPTQSSTALIHTEPPIKPPLLAVGPLAWMRENLFRSWFDTLLTLASAALVVSAIHGLIIWSIFQASWFIITFNLRLFLVGRCEQAADWRAQAITIIVAFVAGFTIAVWSRMSRALVLIALVVIAVTFVAPGMIAGVV